MFDSQSMWSLCADSCQADQKGFFNFSLFLSNSVFVKGLQGTHWWTGEQLLVLFENVFWVYKSWPVGGSTGHRLCISNPEPMILYSKDTVPETFLIKWLLMNQQMKKDIDGYL